LPSDRIAQDLQRSLGALLDGLDEEPGDAVRDLQRDPPTSPAMNGRAFHSASLTVRPKPSRVDFWISTSACDWKALDLEPPTC
jgi:hypothetical protein